MGRKKKEVSADIIETKEELKIVEKPSVKRNFISFFVNQKLNDGSLFYICENVDGNYKMVHYNELKVIETFFGTKEEIYDKVEEKFGLFIEFE